MSDDTSVTVIIPPELRTQFPDIIELILASESMNGTERQYWVDILPVMSPDQIEQLRTILTNERDQLAAIDAKYSDEVSKVNTLDIEGATEERQRKHAELSTVEAAEQTEAEQKAEDILSQMD